MDFKEATEHCEWNDEQRAKWVSWFLIGPAKAMLQCTLKGIDKTSWQKSVKIYVQYGVYLDPCISGKNYTQYSQFGPGKVYERLSMYGSREVIFIRCYIAIYNGIYFMKQSANSTAA